MSRLLIPGILSQRRAPGLDPILAFFLERQGVALRVQPGYVFQDAAGTIPATQDGHRVAFVTDLSGNSNHAIQPVDDGFRPTLRTDGLLWWLEFNGVDQWLVIPQPGFTIDGTYQRTIACARNDDNPVSTANHFVDTGQSADNSRHLVYWNRDRGGSGRSYFNGTAYGTQVPRASEIAVTSWTFDSVQGDGFVWIGGWYDHEVPYSRRDWVGDAEFDASSARNIFIGRNTAQTTHTPIDLFGLVIAYGQATQSDDKFLEQWVANAGGLDLGFGDKLIDWQFWGDFDFSEALGGFRTSQGHHVDVAANELIVMRNNSISRVDLDTWELIDDPDAVFERANLWHQSLHWDGLNYWVGDRAASTPPVSLWRIDRATKTETEFPLNLDLSRPAVGQWSGNVTLSVDEDNDLVAIRARDDGIAGGPNVIFIGSWASLKTDSETWVASHVVDLNERDTQAIFQGLEVRPNQLLILTGWGDGDEDDQWLTAYDFAGNQLWEHQLHIDRRIAGSSTYEPEGIHLYTDTDNNTWLTLNIVLRVGISRLWRFWRTPWPLS